MEEGFFLFASNERTILGYFMGYFKRKQGLKQDNLTGLLDSATLYFQ